MMMYDIELISIDTHYYTLKFGNIFYKYSKAASTLKGVEKFLKKLNPSFDSTYRLIKGDSSLSQEAFKAFSQAFSKAVQKINKKRALNFREIKEPINLENQRASEKAQLLILKKAFKISLKIKAYPKKISAQSLEKQASKATQSDLVKAFYYLKARAKDNQTLLSLALFSMTGILSMLLFVILPSPLLRLAFIPIGLGALLALGTGLSVLIPDLLTGFVSYRSQLYILSPSFLEKLLKPDSASFPNVIKAMNQVPQNPSQSDWGPHSHPFIEKSHYHP